MSFQFCYKFAVFVYSICLQYLTVKSLLTMIIIASRISSQGNRIGPVCVCLSVCLSALSKLNRSMYEPKFALICQWLSGQTDRHRQMGPILLPSPLTQEVMMEDSRIYIPVYELLGISNQSIHIQEQACIIVTGLANRPLDKSLAYTSKRCIPVQVLPPPMRIPNPVVVCSCMYAFLWK